MNPKIELYGAPTGNSLRAAIALEEAGIPYTARRLNLQANEQRDLSYLALNPAGKVPTLVDHSSTSRWSLTNRTQSFSSLMQKLRVGSHQRIVDQNATGCLIVISFS